MGSLWISDGVRGVCKNAYRKQAAYEASMLHYQRRSPWLVPPLCNLSLQTSDRNDTRHVLANLSSAPYMNPIAALLQVSI